MKLTDTIIPKSDQINADDLISGPQTIEITSVTKGSVDQPVNVNYAGGEGRPWKPSKGMRRVLVKAWGDEGDDYVGKKVTLFNNPKVRWAGKEEGGIQISHMSGLKDDKPFSMMLTVSRGKRELYKVQPLIERQKNALTEEVFTTFEAELMSAETMPALAEIAKKIKAGYFDEEGASRLLSVYREAMKIVRGLNENKEDGE